jgi:hypothetical protein
MLFPHFASTKYYIFKHDFSGKSPEIFSELDQEEG